MYRVCKVRFVAFNKHTGSNVLFRTNILSFFTCNPFKNIHISIRTQIVKENLGKIKLNENELI